MSVKIVTVHTIVTPHKVITPKKVITFKQVITDIKDKTVNKKPIKKSVSGKSAYHGPGNDIYKVKTPDGPRIVAI